MRRVRKIVATIAVAAASAAILGCGDSNTEPSIDLDTARDLVAKLDEIRANVDNGSCFVAADQAEEFVAQVQELPSDLDEDVRRALENGGEQLQILLRDPNECETQTETETETQPDTTTDETVTVPTETLPTETQEETQTQTTTPTQPGGGSGGVGPGSPGGP